VVFQGASQILCVSLWAMRRQSLNYHTFNFKNNSKVEPRTKGNPRPPKPPVIHPPFFTTHPSFGFLGTWLSPPPKVFLWPCRITSWKHGYYISKLQTEENGSYERGFKGSEGSEGYLWALQNGRWMDAVLWWLWQHDDLSETTYLPPPQASYYV